MKIEDNISKNYDYYLKNKDVLLKKYNNKFIIIKDEKIFGAYQDLQEAIQNAKELDTGTFIIQHCVKQDETQTFHTRVRFNNA